MFARRRLAGLLGIALAVTMAGPTTTADAAKRRQFTAPVRIATYNAAAFVDHLTAAEDVVRLAQEADVLTLQEMSSPLRRQTVRAALIDCEGCLFDGYMPRDATQGGTPILYRKDMFTFVAAGTSQVSEATYVGPAGAGPSTLRAKYVNWVHLQELQTGRDIFVLNNHAVPSVQGAGGRPNWKLAKRLELYRQHMEGITELVTTFQMTGGAVFVTGDLNVNFRVDRKYQYRWFPYAVMRGIGLRASFDALGEPQIGTHGGGNRLIDYVHGPRMAGVTATKQVVLTGYSSDHRPLVATYALTKQAERVAHH